MIRICRTISSVGLAVAVFAWTGSARAQTLTADQAVRIALQKSTQAANAEASVIDARSGLYRSYAGVLPRVSASYSRFGDRIDDQSGLSFQIDPNTGAPIFTTVTTSDRSYGTTPRVTGSWAVFDLSAFSSLSAGRTGVKAAQSRRHATRQDLALAVRRQFYQVVGSIQLARVSDEALRLSRDDERRVNALFEVGSVSKSDLLKAYVRTAQSELDSLTAHQTATSQRIDLAALIGVPESEIVEIDTVLTMETRVYEEPSVLAEAERARPDLSAADAEWRAAKATLRAARFQRLPYVTVSGTADFNRKSDGRLRGRSETKRQLSGQVALNLDLFDMNLNAGTTSARASEVRARDALEALRRNLAGEVRQALIAHRHALERNRVAESAIASATENLNLTQQKYNVGSATILELIDAQVQLQRAQSDRVTALASIRVAESQIDRVRGRVE